jgi:hypothetical protein
MSTSEAEADGVPLVRARESCHRLADFRRLLRGEQPVQLGAGVAMKLDLGVQGPALVFQCLGPDNIPIEVRAPKDS